MPDLPVMLKLAGRRCVIVGGGAVAVRRAEALLETGAHVLVVAPRLHPRLKDLAIEHRERAFEPDDIRGATLVVVATDEPATNERAALAAREAGALVNRADDPEAGDLAVPAHERHGPVTIAVHSGGISATAAVAIRRELAAALADHWPAFLEAAAPWREHVQTAFAQDPEARQQRLAALGGRESVRCWVEEGPAAWERFARRLADPQARPPEAAPGSADTESGL